MSVSSNPSASPLAMLSNRRRWVALGVLGLAVLLLAIDGTVLSLAVPALTEALAPTAEQVLWIGDIYSLALAGLLVLMGNLADRFGRKRVLLVGSVAFGAASLLAAFSVTAELLIAARLLLGVACLVLGVGGGVLFVRRQRRLASPMIDVALFRNPAFCSPSVPRSSRGC